MSAPSAARAAHPRAGLLSVLTLLMALLLGVLAVLSVATAHASDALADRSQMMAQEGYAAESAGQEFLARLDGRLAQGQSAPSSLAQVVGSDAREAADDAASGQIVSASAQVDDGVVSASFTTEHGRTLSIEARVTDSQTIDVESWRLSTVETQEDQGQTLWSGTTDEGN